MAIADDVGESKQDLTEFKKLTLREQEILDVMIRGLSDRKIAATLFISERTIRTYICNMVDRLDVGDRFQLMCYANATLAHRRNTV